MRKMQEILKWGLFGMAMSAAAFAFVSCSSSVVTPNDLKFAPCYHQGTKTAKNCEEVDFVTLLESKKEWKIHSYHFKGKTIILEKNVDNLPILKFSKNQIYGTFGCNQFFGSYLIQEQSFHLDNVGMTRKMCEPNTMTHEDILVQNFLNASTKILVVEESKGMSKIFFIGKDFYLVLN